MNKSSDTETPLYVHIVGLSTFFYFFLVLLRTLKAMIDVKQLRSFGPVR